MAELTTLARPYARAAFEFAKDLKALDRWSNMLGTVVAVVANPAVSNLLSSPSITAEQKGQSLTDVCGDDIDNKVANFLQYLAINNRLSLLAQVRELFELYKANFEKSIDVEVTTAYQLSDQQQEKLVKSLKAKLEREVSIQSSVDTSLIGGVVVRAGDLVIDGSVRGRLAKLAESLSI
jgi:F-type H+-transporting ATPase subunit delta